MPPTNDASVLGEDVGVPLFPAYAYRQGLDGGEWGVRITAPGSLQLDGKAATASRRWAGSLGLGFGTDVGSLAALAVKGSSDETEEAPSDEEASPEDDLHPLTFDLFVPAVGSFEIVPEYLSLHVVLRPEIWVFTPGDEEDRHVQFSGILAGGLRAGKDFGVHLEAAPVWTSGYGLGFMVAGSVFYRLEARASGAGRRDDSRSKVSP